MPVFGRVANHPTGHVGQRTSPKITAIPTQSADGKTEDKQRTGGSDEKYHILTNKTIKTVLKSQLSTVYRVL